MNENQLLNQSRIDLDTFFGNANQITLQAYEKRVIEYTESVKSPRKALKRWIDFSMKTVSKEKIRILEVGSATPRDAQYMRSFGHTVTCSDATKGFIDYLSKNGESPIKLNVLTDPIPKNYDMIFANAVFQHMNGTELKYIIKKVYNSLENKGVFSFSLKQGEGEAWITEKFTDKRFVKYWQPAEIATLLLANDFAINFLESGVQGDLPNHRWINIVTQKR